MLIFDKLMEAGASCLISAQVALLHLMSGTSAFYTHCCHCILRRSSRAHLWPAEFDRKPANVDDTVMDEVKVRLSSTIAN